MLEAMTAGCIPVAPDRMAYPEYIPAELLYRPDAPGNQSRVNQNRVNQNEEGERSEVLETQALYLKLVQVIEGEIKDSVVSNIDIRRYTFSEVMPRYQQLFTSFISSSVS